MFGLVFGLTFLFSAIDRFKWFTKNIHIMLVLLIAPFVDLHISFYTLMAFMMMLSVILLSMLMILLSTLNVIRASDLWQQLELVSELKNLTYKTLLTGAWSDLLISMLGKHTCQLVSFDWSNNFSAIDVKMGGSSPEKKYFSFKLDWGSHVGSIAKIEALIHFINFLSSEVAFYKSTIQLCMEYCCYVWGGAPIWYLDMSDKLQNRYLGLLVQHLPALSLHVNMEI